MAHGSVLICLLLLFPLWRLAIPSVVMGSAGVPSLSVRNHEAAKSKPMFLLENIVICDMPINSKSLCFARKNIEHLLSNSRYLYGIKDAESPPVVWGNCSGPIRVDSFPIEVDFGFAYHRVNVADQPDIFGGGLPSIHKENIERQWLIQRWNTANSLYNDPCPLVQSRSILRGLDTSFSVVDSRLQLFCGVGNAPINILSRIRELLSSVGLVAGSISQSMGIDSTLMHLPQLAVHRPPLQEAYNDRTQAAKR